MSKISRFFKVVGLTVMCSAVVAGSAVAMVYASAPQPHVFKEEDQGTIACAPTRCAIFKNIDRVICDQDQCRFSLTGGLGSIVCSSQGCVASREVLAQFFNNKIPKQCPDGRCTMSFDPKL